MGVLVSKHNNYHGHCQMMYSVCGLGKGICEECNLVALMVHVQEFNPYSQKKMNGCVSTVSTINLNWPIEIDNQPISSLLPH